MNNTNIRIRWYEGSLDFSCEECNSNSYNNFHICEDDGMVEIIKYVICMPCLIQIKEFENEIYKKCSITKEDTT